MIVTSTHQIINMVQVVDRLTEKLALNKYEEMQCFLNAASSMQRHLEEFLSSVGLGIIVEDNKGQIIFKNAVAHDFLEMENIDLTNSMSKAMVSLGIHKLQRKVTQVQEQDIQHLRQRFKAKTKSGLLKEIGVYITCCCRSL